MKLFLGYSCLLTVAFGVPLASLALYAVHSELNSHVLLVPVISAYLLRIHWGRLPTDYYSSWTGAVVLAAAGIAILVAAWTLGPAGYPLSHNDHLTLTTLAFVCLLVAGGFAFSGAKWMGSVAFPFAFLLFMVPLPGQLVYMLETASKLASAEAANLFFNMTGTSVLRTGTVFELPGITVQVAQECSGIRSSWVLVMTSLLAAHLFLRSPWRKVWLVAFVIPLGILRNGFRILVIGLLCVHVGPEMIHSAIHNRGGPIFFALSLIPLSLLLWWLRRGEGDSVETATPPRPEPGSPQ